MGKIMIVEDDSGIVQMYRDQANDANLVVTFCSTAVEAMNEMAWRDYAILVTDGNFPIEAGRLPDRQSSTAVLKYAQSRNVNERWIASCDDFLSENLQRCGLATRNVEKGKVISELSKLFS